MAKTHNPARTLWLDLQKSISPKRLSPYTDTADKDELDSLGRYFWNIALCEAMYPSLQCVEISLRNAMNYAIHRHTKNAFWFDDPTLLGPNEISKVGRAKTELVNHGKRIEPGRVVAELTFGFWTSLFAAPYEHTILMPIVSSVFPGMPPVLQNRSDISTSFGRIKTLRNRVFHHEPIWYVPDLDKRHDEILNAIAWINPRKRAYVEVIDRFEEIYKLGWQHYRAEVEFQLLIEEEARIATTKPSP